jgi:Nuclease-related domain
VSARAEAPGAAAENIFRLRRRAWRRRIWWAFALVAALELAVGLGFALLFHPPHVGFFVGLTVGATVGMLMALGDSPPQHIERWRSGAEGEKATAKALRKLPAGWEVVHDIDIGRGNVDHVVVGPPGVFVLDSKNLSGVVSIEAGVLSVRWREDPEDGYELPKLASRMRWLARTIEARLHGDGVRATDVQPVVVIWAPFEQRSRLSGRVAWVSGKEVGRVLANRPGRLSCDEVAEIAAALRRPWRQPVAAVSAT